MYRATVWASLASIAASSAASLPSSTTAGSRKALPHYCRAHLVIRLYIIIKLHLLHFSCNLTTSFLTWSSPWLRFRFGSGFWGKLFWVWSTPLQIDHLLLCSTGVRLWNVLAAYSYIRHIYDERIVRGKVTFCDYL